MPPIVETVLTVLIVTALGWALTRWSLIRQDHWEGFEHIAYQVFFPALVLHALIKADLSAVPSLAFGITLFLTIVVAAALLVLLARPIMRITGTDGPGFTSLFQGTIRWNTFMAFGLIESLYGARGLTLMAVAIAAIIPLVNVVSVLVLRRFAGGAGSFNPLYLLRNPFIWSSLLGLAINLSGLPVPNVLVDAAGMCGKASLAGALLLVGSGLKLGDLERPNAAILLSSGLKLLGLPLLAAALAWPFGIRGADLGVLVLCAAVPTASAGYILARQMGGDARLMAAIITVQTLVSALTLPAMLLLLAR
ncbi:MAG TPA: AEC family transporter [Beijerinckiaceae bacterium]|nr:AEC family transporter [Beijerinckiaceae bacterium]